MGELVIRDKQTSEGANKPTIDIAKNIKEWLATKLRIQTAEQKLSNRAMEDQIRAKQKAREEQDELLERAF